MNDRDLSNYEVVRKDFISDPEEVYLNFSKGKIYVNSYGVKQFPDEDYIRILINQETRSLVIKPYKEKVRASFCWCGGKIKRKNRQVKCLPLFYQVYKMMNWDINARYRITGSIEESEEERIIYFDLDEAVCFISEPMYVENGIRPKSRIQMPQEWEKHYGMPVMDFDERHDIKTFGNMAVFDVEFEMDRELIKTAKEVDKKNTESLAGQKDIT